MSNERSCSMKAVFEGVMNYLESQGYTKGTIKPYKTALYRMQHFYDSAGVPYSLEHTSRLMEDVQTRFESGTISKTAWRNARRITAMANEFFLNGVITLGTYCVTDDNSIKLTETNEKLVQEYIVFLKSRNLTHSTILTNSDDASLFLEFFENANKPDVSSLSNSDIATYIPYIAARRPGSVGNCIINTRHFLEFLRDKGTVSAFAPEALNVHISRPRKIHYGFTSEEVESILGAVDTSTEMGKRDYAILILAARTGLRSVDIRNLRLQNIKWEQSEIHIIQRKTQKPLILPLMKDVGDAIADYILNARPKITDAPVFLRLCHPYSGIRNIDHIVEKYARLSGVAETTQARLSIHSFRRALGVSLLDADVPLYTITEVLGHSHKNATKKYIALDVGKLQFCAAPMKAFTPKEVVG